VAAALDRIASLGLDTKVVVAQQGTHDRIHR
jgi:hypothetical protein